MQSSYKLPWECVETHTQDLEADRKEGISESRNTQSFISADLQTQYYSLSPDHQRCPSSSPSSFIYLLTSEAKYPLWPTTEFNVFTVNKTSTKLNLIKYY